MEDDDEGNGFNLPERALEDRRITSGTIVRAMSPAGIYWSDSLSFPSAICINSGDLIFTACHFDEDHQPSDFYTDFDDPRVEECRLYAALGFFEEKAQRDRRFAVGGFRTSTACTFAGVRFR